MGVFLLIFWCVLLGLVTLPSTYLFPILTLRPLLLPFIPPPFSPLLPFILPTVSSSLPPSPPPSSFLLVPTTPSHFLHPPFTYLSLLQPNFLPPCFVHFSRRSDHSPHLNPFYSPDAVTPLVSLAIEFLHLRLLLPLSSFSILFAMRCLICPAR